MEEGTGKELIVEVNGTSSGLHPDYSEEDNKHIANLVLTRMEVELCARSPASSSETTHTA